MLQIIGWMSSALLLATLVNQVYKEWHDGTTKGVSKWLFIGQLFVSIGFTAYSIGTGDMVFIVTNSLLVLNSVAGIVIYFHHGRRAR